ncbi:MAG TPA: hypothetical protein VMS96_00870 [Terriglobales bacterium]|nr:hypothetical protein [Terriglobales bacterium]
MLIRRLLLAFCSIALFSLGAAAQDQSPPKVEIFAGYSYLHPGSANAPDESIPAGWGTNVTYNFTPHFGFGADFGGHYSDTSNISTILFGPKFTLLNGEHARPFVHALFGLARVSPSGLSADNSVGLALGGGLDLKVHRNIAIRLIEADWVRAEPDFLSEAVNAARVRTGLVFLLGGGPPPAPPTAACSVQPTEVFAGEGVRATVTPGGFNPKHPVDIAWTASGGLKVAGKETANIDTKGLNPGSYTLTAKVTDTKNPKATASCNTSFRVKERPKNPPQVACSANPSTVQSGTPSTISCSCSSPDNSADYPVTASITNWSSSAGRVSGSGNSATLDTAGASPGPITVTATCTDSRNLSSNGTANVNVENPPPPPEASKLNECSYTNKAKPARVDNACKAALDDYALRLQRDADAKGVIVGNKTAKEKVKNLAGQRAANVKEYMTKEKGIDPARLETRSGSADAASTEQWIVPAGATFKQAGTEPVMEKPTAPAKKAKTTAKKPAAAAPKKQ